ncbi:MAG: TerB family tellurite resistance protein [Polyangiaceae bacterium]|nr:TerB family tellurite resistance protein [Polyangiaceae bacterium]
MDEPLPIDDLDEPKIEALVEMMVLAASADGDFAPEERARLERNVLSLMSRRLGAEHLPSMLADLERRIAEQGRAKRLLAVKVALGDAGSRRVALDLALQVMKEDGVLRTTERELILEIAEALEIDRDDAANMVRALGA